MGVRFLRDLPAFYRPPMDLSFACTRLQEARRSREEVFLGLLDRAVWGNPWSPYRRLLESVGIAAADLSAMVRADGVEATLLRLHDEGVYVTLEEFKGRVALKRGQLEIPAAELAFDNPGLRGHLRVQSGGSGGRPMRLVVDLDLLQLDAAAYSLMLEEWGVRNSPLVLWRPLPPGAAGVKRYLVHSRLGLCPADWFAQEIPGAWMKRIRSRGFVTLMILVARLASGLPLPFPRLARLAEAPRLARRLHELVIAGAGFHCDTNVSSALRIVRAADKAGLDLTGGFFRVGGEPLTDSRYQVFRAAGCRVGCNYSMSEIGAVGHGCSQGESVDEVHLRDDKVAVIQRDVMRGHARIPGAFFLTSIHPQAPKMMLNVQVGDAGRISRRDCGCSFDRMGFRTRLSGVLSFEKLSTEGMHFLGADLLVLLEKVLPEKFGGGPDHYQLAELDGPEGVRVYLRVHPAVGPVDEERCRSTVYEHLRSAAPENRLMVERWQQSGTLQIVRVPPATTGSSKVLALDRAKGA